MEVGAVTAVGGLGSIMQGQIAANARPQPTTPSATATSTPLPDQDPGVVVSLSPIAAMLTGSSNAP